MCLGRQECGGKTGDRACSYTTQLPRTSFLAIAIAATIFMDCGNAPRRIHLHVGTRRSIRLLWYG